MKRHCPLTRRKRRWMYEDKDLTKRHCLINRDCLIKRHCLSNRDCPNKRGRLITRHRLIKRGCSKDFLGNSNGWEKTTIESNDFAQQFNCSEDFLGNSKDSKDLSRHMLKTLIKSKDSKDSKDFQGNQTFLIKKILGTQNPRNPWNFLGNPRNDWISDRNPWIL